MNQTQRIAGGSILVGCLVLALKAAAWKLTGSSALYADALETVVNVVAASVAFWAILVASRPADDVHPYGQGKAEFIAAVVEGTLIVAASLSILQHAWHVWQHPHLILAPRIGLALNALATAMNAGWAALLFHFGKRDRSPALLADGRHLLTDVVTSTGVFAGVLLVVTTGILKLDPLVAAGTAVYVLTSGLGLIRQSIQGLMDRAPVDGTVARIMELVAANGKGAIEAHDFRTRQAGRLTFLQFHLVVPGDMRVEQAHLICDRIEAALKTDMAYLRINIHIEPEHKAKRQDALAL